jgi:hypothetical protein
MWATNRTSVMPMIMKNLAIVQHQNTWCYATIQGGDYWLGVQKFELKNYVHLYQTTSIMLDVIVRCVILHVWKVLLSKVLLLGGQDG